jgi:curved DNA-binding protein CbpA
VGTEFPCLVGQEMNCPHKILGVSKTATLNEIKLAYRRLAMQLHPDTNGGDQKKSEQFKQVASAYEILSNPESRKKWEFEQKYGNGWGDMTQASAAAAAQYAQYASAASRRHGRSPGGGNGMHFDESEWNAFHYGIDIDDFDFSGPEEFIIDMSTGKVKRSARKQKSSKKSSSHSTNSSRDAFHEFSHEEVEEILRHATRSPKHQKSSSSSHHTTTKKTNHHNNNTKKTSSSSPSSGRHSNQPKNNSRRSGRKDSPNDCTIS